MELRTIQDWVVRRQLSGIPGVVEVNTWGGFLKQYEVAINPERIKGLGISLLDVFEAVEANNGVAGGAYIEKQDQSFFIRGDGLVSSLEDLEKVVVSTTHGTPIPGERHCQGAFWKRQPLWGHYRQWPWRKGPGADHDAEGCQFQQGH
jgi:cobalt-zinc-cadmium resistance protein CzcA